MNAQKDSFTLGLSDKTSDGHMRNGIVVLSDGPYYARNHTAKDVEELILICERKGWKEAMLHYYRDYPRRDEGVNTCISKKGFDWKRIVPLNADSVVMDAGCGWAHNSISLAVDCKTVFAVDLDEERLIINKFRFEEEGIRNIRLFKADLTSSPFPFPENQFDFVLMSGVLEHVATNKKHDNPYLTQLDTLKGIRYSLKNNGYFYLGIENRFAYRNFLGLMSHHDIPFTTIMPRSIANIVNKLMKGKSYTKYIYSYGGYMKILKQAGFRDVKIFIVFSYSTPWFMMPTDGKEKIWKFFAYIAPRYGIIARK